MRIRIDNFTEKEKEAVKKYIGEAEAVEATTEAIHLTRQLTLIVSRLVKQEAVAIKRAKPK